MPLKKTGESIIGAALFKVAQADQCELSRSRNYL
jgi:hypothetical protein